MLPGIECHADKPFDALSGGERQMVLIARALAAQCRCMVLDEPTSALDFSNQSVILSTLKRLAREDGLSILFTTHSPNHALRMSDFTLLMIDVHQHEYGVTSEVLTETRLERLYRLPVLRRQVTHGHRQIETLVPVFED
ncbi:MAG: ATP-binding cassette domain-containing protein [Marinomonas foliarum]|uniref:ABC transporter ATP-binding protein n=1 Tax=Marinomonas foliarum TaxID=491950 RepID=UPI001A1A6525|nr:ATP-binding cassette domain-containing protein [Vibrio vulnificus]